MTSSHREHDTGPKVLVLGATGMLGHKLCQHLASDCDVWGTVRSPSLLLQRAGILETSRQIAGVSAGDPATTEAAIASCHPEVIINAIGVVKQASTASDWPTAVGVNGVFPHQVAAMARGARARFIHVSTDCVFSGRRGNYRETDTPDAMDVYGKSKLVGEVSGNGCFTIRTSIIGRELQGAQGLVEWLFSQRGNTIAGYTKAVFSGLPTVELAGLVSAIVMRNPSLTGLNHISANPITKYDLLCMIAKEAGIPVTIRPDDSVRIDRSLDSEPLRQILGWQPPSWPELVRRMIEDASQYATWRTV